MNFKEEGEENKLSSKWIEVDMSWLRYKDLDLLEGIFKFWKSEGRDAMNVKLSFGVRLKQIAQGRDNLGGFQLKFVSKYKPGYKSHDLLWIRVLSLVENLFLKKNPLQDLLSSLNAVISTNESAQFITGHVIYNPAYTSDP